MRLLVLSAGCGAGHNRAAEAVDAGAREHFPDVESEWVDSLKFTSRLFQKMYGDSYVWVAGGHPRLWGALYAAMGKKKERPIIDRAVKLYDRLAYRKLKKRVEAFRADAIVTTHFLPTNVVLTRFGKKCPPVYVVVTDFDVHSAWINEEASGYFVGNEEVKWQLGRFGIPAERVHVTGIPIMPVFGRRRGRETVLRELGLVPRGPVILFMSGGFGMGGMEEVVESLLRLPSEHHLIVVCGRNEKVRKNLEKLAPQADDRLRVHGFVTNVHDLMEAADVLITKAGGLSVSEGLARAVPMVVVMPVPGQEERNTDYLLERGAALKAKGPETLDFKVQELLEAPDRLAKMKRAAESIARPDAARDIVRIVREQASK